MNETTLSLNRLPELQAVFQQLFASPEEIMLEQHFIAIYTFSQWSYIQHKTKVKGL